MSDGWPRDDGRPSWWSHFGMGESEKWGREWGVTAWIWRRWRNVRKSLQFGKPEKVEDPLEISDNLKQHQQTQSFPGGLKGKEFACNAGYQVSIPGLGRYPEERNIYLLQYSCLENSMDRGAWQATVHGVAKIQTWLSTCTHMCMGVHTHTHIHTHTHSPTADKHHWLVSMSSHMKASKCLSCALKWTGFYPVNNTDQAPNPPTTEGQTCLFMLGLFL